jgi:hypothetical protein
MAHRASRRPVRASRAVVGTALLGLLPLLAGADPASAPSAARVTRALGRLPVRFERNDGQTDPRVRFLSRGPGYGLFLTSSEVVLSLDETPVPGPGPLARRALPRQAPGKTSVLRMRFAGARARPEVEGIDPLPARSHYFVGSDPKRWRADVPQYGRVTYRSLWKGIDLTFYGTAQGRLEWDFTVSPGADPKTIRLAFEGARSLRLDGEGNLVIRTEAGEVVQRRPHLYQDVGGVRTPRSGSWVLRGKRRAGFRVGGYDRTAPLVIDPVLVYSTYLGGGRDETALAVAADAAGNVFVTGWTSSTDFPTAGPPFQGSHAGTTDVFVAKLSPSSGLVYSTYLGGGGTDYGTGIAVDVAGNAYITGETTSTDFPTAGPPFQPTSGGGHDAFVAKLSPTSGLVYSTYLGGGGYDVGNGIAVDAAGSAYLTGATDSWDLPLAGLPFQITPGGGFDAFVAALGPTSTLVYSTYLGSVGEDVGLGVAADAAGNAYVTGKTDSASFPTAGPPFQASIGGSTDAFVAKLSPARGLAYSTFLGGADADAGSAIAVDGAGGALVAGDTLSTDFPTAGPPSQPSAGGYYDAFVAKVSPTPALVYSTFLGGSGYDFASGIATDGAGSAYVAGVTASADFPTAGRPIRAAPAGGFDAFVARLGPTSSLVYSTYLGGSRDDTGAGIALDALRNVYVAGTTNSTDFPTAGTPFQPSSAGRSDAFVASLGSGRSSFFTLTPCRVADTRDAAGPSGGPALGANASRLFPVSGLCGIPSSATAVAFNVTVVDETDYGDLRIYPAGGGLPGSSTINFTANRVRANNAVIPLGTGGQIGVTCDMPAGSTGRTHLVLDVAGYFQ